MNVNQKPEALDLPGFADRFSGTLIFRTVSGVKIYVIPCVAEVKYPVTVKFDSVNYANVNTNGYALWEVIEAFVRQLLLGSAEDWDVSRDGGFRKLSDA